MVWANSCRIPLAPQYSGNTLALLFSCRLQDYHLLRLSFPKHSSMNFQAPSVSLLHLYEQVWALPSSLAATSGISFDFFSCRYLDVSIPCVCFLADNSTLLLLGSPIRTPADQCILTCSPQRFAGLCVLLRRLVPRHPPYALCSLLSNELLYSLFTLALR